MVFRVAGNDYKLEYAFEAALNKECVDICWNYFSGAYVMRGQTLEGMNQESATKVLTIDKMIGFMSDIPAMSIYLFYAGLLENHADEIRSEDDAKALYKLFRKENPDDERAKFNGLLDAIKTQMENDGFFKEIGLEEFMKGITQTEETTQPPKMPQDHKKKASPFEN